MIALSIRQPWASFIVAGIQAPGEPPIYKNVENRDWHTPYRGRMLVHASKNKVRKEFESAIASVEDALGVRVDRSLDDFPRGGVIGSVEIVDCVTVCASPWFVGAHGFLLANPRALPFQPIVGRLGFFNVHGITP